VAASRVTRRLCDTRLIKPWLRQVFCSHSLARRDGGLSIVGVGSRSPTRHLCSICSVVRTRDRVAGAGFACNARPDLHTTICRSFTELSSDLRAKFCGGSRSAKSRRGPKAPTHHRRRRSPRRPHRQSDVSRANIGRPAPPIYPSVSFRGQPSRKSCSICKKERALPAPPLLPVTFLVRADELCVGQNMAPHRSLHLGFCRAF
jgi:hypothetical protein